MKRFTQSIVSSLFMLPLLAAPAFAGGDFWAWTLTNGDAPWARRAGLQVVELDDRLYLMGGRTSRPPMNPPVPGDSEIWGDVWVSDDLGATWERIRETGAPGGWPARAYYRALTMGEHMFVLGGQDYLLIGNPACPPPHDGCAPFISVSNFFNDVWRSKDGEHWTELTSDAGWSQRAGLSAVVHDDAMYVVGGSFLDDPAIIGGPPVRIYYNDVWKSHDGITWEQVAANPPFDPRAGAVLVSKGEYMYLVGGEAGFLCEPLPFCALPYFNDVWRSRDGEHWEMVTADAGWSPRPGHQVVVVGEYFVLFGGFGINPLDPFAPANPMDIWVSKDGANWYQISDSPWNADAPDQIKYDFAALVVEEHTAVGPTPAILTFGGDRETFNFFDPFNYLNMDNDAWRFAPVLEPPCPADLNGNGFVGLYEVFAVLHAWGPCTCPEDLNGNGHVGLLDLLIVLESWGACP